MGQSLMGLAGIAVAGSVNLLSQLVILLFVLFFLYRDRDRALDALRTLVPLSDSEMKRMLARIENTILAIVNGSLTVAFVQALVAGVMYTILGVPAPVSGPLSPSSWRSFPYLEPSWCGAHLRCSCSCLAVGSNGNPASLGILVVASIDNVLYPLLVETASACIRFPHSSRFWAAFGYSGPRA